MTEEFTELKETTLADAEAARMNVGALVELLEGCPHDYKLSAGLFVGLLLSVNQYLDNVVVDLRTQAGVPPLHLVAARAR